MSFPNVSVRNRTSGAVYIGDTTEVAGEFVSIDSLSDSTKFEVLTGNQTGLHNATAGSAPAIPKATRIDGYFTAIKLHAGAVIAYNK